MRTPSLVAMVLLLAVTSACSFQNKYEKQAQQITQALVANDLTPVMGEIPPGAITRVQVAEYSDELKGYGKLESLKEVPANCPASYHCFDVQFEKRLVNERMSIDDKGQVARFYFHAADAVSTPTP